MKNFITKLLSDNKSKQDTISSKRFVLVTSTLVFGICILVSTYAELTDKHVSFATELIYALASVAGGSYVGGKFSEINRNTQSTEIITPSQQSLLNTVEEPTNISNNVDSAYIDNTSDSNTGDVIVDKKYNS